MRRWYLNVSGLGTDMSVLSSCDWLSKRESCSDWSVVVWLLFSIRLLFVCWLVSFEVMYESLVRCR